MRLQVFLILVAFSALAQPKQGRFTLPQNAQGQYAPGVVLAKLKPEKKGMDVKQALGGKSRMRSAKTFVSEKQQAKLRTQVAPRLSPSSIDLSLYVEIAFDGDDIETFINQLYSTGYFDVVEPDYTAKLHYVTNDINRTNQYYLQKIKAQEAWDITKGSYEIVIGIVDSGVDIDHPDLSGQLYSNLLDPIDGLDNDQDGYVDNNRGWDFIGSDTANVNRSDFLGDNNPNNPTEGLGSHGTAVGGCASATTDNSIGISGVGFNSKLLFTKHSAENQGTNNGTIYRGYEGILYAATHNAKIINCSWGGYVYSQIHQDIINYVALDLNRLIIASAGNENTGVPCYPASYDHVLSVASSNKNDVRSRFSNFGKTVDLIAPGDDIFTTFSNDTYKVVDGTSFSAPITAGAAALVWAINPTWTAGQVGEQIRVSADESVYQHNAINFANNLGKGRLDVLRALTIKTPSIRATSPKLLNNSGSVAQPGEDAFLSFDLKNYLYASSPNLSITLTAVQSSLVNVEPKTIQPGAIGTNQSINTRLKPFKLKINSVVDQNSQLDFLLTYSDGEYSDFQWISFVINPSFLDVDDNQIITTLASNGRIGHEQPSSQTNGVGFIFNDNNLLYEMGLITGSSSTTAKLFDNVRASNNTFNQEFLSSQKIKEIIPGERSYSEIFGAFTDNGISKTVSVKYRSLVWKEQPRDRFVILEYQVKNVSGQPLNNFNLGLFADWDVANNGSNDIAGWDQENLLGFVRSAQDNNRPIAGIALIKAIAPHYYAIDNNQNTPGAPFGLYDGFTDTEKTTAFSSGIARTSAGESTGIGADVSHVIGAGPYNLATNEEITITFALVAAPTLAELKAAVSEANVTYNLMLAAPKPIALPVDICYGTPATVEATGASNFNWYTSFTGGTPFTSGNSFTTGNLFSDTIFYVSNADAPYESVRTAVPIKTKANPVLLTSGTGVLCEGKTITLSVAEADNYLWSTGAITQSIEVGQAGVYSLHVETIMPACESNSEEFTVYVNPTPIAGFTINGDLISNKTITFTNTSTGASHYSWSFGDTESSVEPSPTYSYSTVKEYTVTLTATNEFGCSNSTNETIQIITALAESQIQTNAFPVPAKDWLEVNHSLSSCSWKIFDPSGKLQLAGESNDDSGKLLIDVRRLASGFYYLTIQGNSKQTTLRIIKAVD